MLVPLTAISINGLIHDTPLALLLKDVQVVLLQMDSLLGLQFLEQEFVFRELFLADDRLVYLVRFAAVFGRL